MKAEVQFRHLQELLDGPRPDCAHDLCQELAEWAAIAPTITICSCSSHLGSLLEMADPLRRLVWFVHRFPKE